jgi:hypothetical protein
MTSFGPQIIHSVSPHDHGERANINPKTPPEGESRIHHDTPQIRARSATDRAFSFEHISM